MTEEHKPTQEHTPHDTASKGFGDPKKTYTVIAGVVLAVVVAGALMYSKPTLLTGTYTNVNDHVADLEKRVQALQHDVEALKSHGKSSSDMGVAEGMVNAIKDLVKGQETPKYPVPDRSKIRAYIDLRTALMHSGPYIKELESALKAMEGSPEIQALLGRLRAFAELGVPAPMVLAEQARKLDFKANPNLQSQESGQQLGLLQRLWEKLKSVVHVDKTAVASASEDLKGQLMKALQAGDLASAIAISESALQSQPHLRPILEAWIAHARARVEVADIMKDLEVAFIESLFKGQLS